MPITGEYPEGGVRFEVELLRGNRGNRGNRDDREDRPPWTYAGHAVAPGARWALQAVVSEAGSVTVTLEEGAPEGTAERVRLLLRAAWKHALAEGRPAPPRRLQRWRDDR
jgi:hypothetical protein